MLLRVVSLVLFISAAGFASVAKEADLTPDVTPVVSAETIPKTGTELYLEVVRAEIEKRKRGRFSGSYLKRLNKVSDLYNSSQAKAFWTSKSAVQSDLKSIKLALANSEYWGLLPEIFILPEPPVDMATSIEARANREIDISLHILHYAEHAYGARVDPTKLSLWLNNSPRNVDAKEIVPFIASAKNPGHAMRTLHPKHRDFSVLLQAYRQRNFPELHKKVVAKNAPKDVIIPRGRTIKQNASHPHVELVRKRLGVPSPYLEGERFYDARLADAVAAFMKKQGWKKYRKTRIDKYVRRALNKAPLSRKRARKSITLSKLLINMDRWRRLPEDLGKFHIRNNLPSYETAVYKSGARIHKERIIVGKPTTQTPVFSDRMEHVVFKPNWGVPSSIKIKQLLPRLRGGDYSVLSRRGMYIRSNSGRELSPRRFKWNRTDITQIPIFQRPGRSNPLGQVKFIFPNKHSVYMHDTPKRGLFKSKARMFSHGCIRVRNPKRLAEVIFEEMQGWDRNRLYANFHRKAKGNNKVLLDNKIRVHNTYFTLHVTDDGKIVNLRDIYGHDKRIAKAMRGVSVAKIARADPALRQKKELANIIKNRSYAIRRVIKTPRTHSAALAGFPPPAGLLKAPKPYYYAKPKKYYRRSNNPAFNPMVSTVTYKRRTYRRRHFRNGRRR